MKENNKKQKLLSIVNDVGQFDLINVCDNLLEVLGEIRCVSFTIDALSNLLNRPQNHNKKFVKYDVAIDIANVIIFYNAIYRPWKYTKNGIMSMNNQMYNTMENLANTLSIRNSKINRDCILNSLSQDDDIYVSYKPYYILLPLFNDDKLNSNNLNDISDIVHLSIQENIEYLMDVSKYYRDVICDNDIGIKIMDDLIALKSKYYRDVICDNDIDIKIMDDLIALKSDLDVSLNLIMLIHGISTDLVKSIINLLADFYNDCFKAFSNNYINHNPFIITKENRKEIIYTLMDGINIKTNIFNSIITYLIDKNKLN